MPKIVIGPQIGEIVKDGKVISQDFLIWCEICLTKRIKNHQKLTKADKKYVDSCEMKDWVVKEKDGTEMRGKSCGRCHQTLVLEGEYWKGASKT